MNKLYVLGAAFMLSPLFMNAQTECTPHEQVSNAFENGTFNETDGVQRLANDFIVSANTINFSATSFSANLLTQEEILSVDLRFFIDAAGAPGAEITDEALIGVVPTSQATVGAAFGYDVVTVVVDFDAIDFPGTGTGPVTYWVQLSGATATTPTEAGSAVGWETTSVGVIGNSLYFDNEGTTDWTEGAGEDGVFSISGECTYAEGCLVPENVTVSNATTSSFDVMWTEVGTATEWVLEYGAPGFTIGSGTMVTDNDGTPGITIADLEATTSYDVYIKSVCTEDESASAGPIAASTTEVYCVVVVSTGVEPITNVEFAGIANVSAADSPEAAEYFLDMEATVSQNGTFPIALEGFTGGNFNTSWVVFFDWNQDFDFDDADERYEIGFLANSTGTDGAQLTGNIAVPADATLGSTRMRVLKMYTASEAYPASACGPVGYGQSEDYSVNVGIETSLEFAEFEFKMGPNPTHDFVNISATENIERVALYNLLGQQVYVNTLNVQSPRIDLSSFENGVYMMTITIKGQEQVFKVVKQ